MIFTKSFKQFVSEFICTMLLVKLMCLACSALNNALIPLSFAYGIIQLVLIYCFKTVSGAHANPAVSIALYLRGCLNFKRLLIYVAAQVSGGVVGHIAANKILGKALSDNLCSFGPTSELPDKSIMAVEFLLTFVLVMTWCVLWEYEGELPMECYLAAVNILVCLVGGHLTGASTNPARALAPAFFVAKADRTPIIIGAQVLAGIVAPMAWGFMDY